MAFFNYAAMQMAAKIVYYGPGLCGKTTNLQYIYNKTSPKSRGEMVSLETDTDRTLFFDLLPLEVGIIAGFRTRFQLYTVPGQVFYGETRKMVLKGVDGVVFVADSQKAIKESNVESLNDLKTNLEDMGIKWGEIPIVFQFNKRDLSNILEIDELHHLLNSNGCPENEAIAVRGVGVFDTLREISRLTLQTLKSKLSVVDDSKRPKIISVGGAQLKQKAEVTSASQIQKSASTAEEAIEVTFATRKTEVKEEEIAKKAPEMRKISVKPGKSIEGELDRIRESLFQIPLVSSRPRVKDLSPSIESLMPVTKKPRVVEASCPLKGDAIDTLTQITIQIILKDKPIKSIIVKQEDMDKTADGMLLRLKVILKKS